MEARCQSRECEYMRVLSSSLSHDIHMELRLDHVAFHFDSLFFFKWTYIYMYTKTMFL